MNYTPRSIPNGSVYVPPPIPNLQPKIDNVATQLAEITKGIGIKTPTNLSDLSVYIVGDSTSDESLSYSTTNSPTICLHNRLNREWFATGKPLAGARKFTYAKNGITLLDFLNNINAGVGIDDLINKANDPSEDNRLKIVVFSLGHNGSPSEANYNTRLIEMHTAMNRILGETDCQILLRMPNQWLVCDTVDVETATEYTRVLNRLYKQVSNNFPRTKLLDVQSVLEGGAYATSSWVSGEVVTAHSTCRFNGDKASALMGGASVYQAITSGTTGATMPIGTGANINDGAVTWKYVGALNPYAGDPIHLNKMGYEVIADLIGSAIVSMMSKIDKNKYIPKYLSKPYSSLYTANSEPSYNIIISGNMVQRNATGAIIDLDFNQAKNKIQIKDILKPYNQLGYAITVDDKISRPTDRTISTSYATGTIISAVDQYGYPATFECVLAGTSGIDTYITLQNDQRNTYILDGTVRWMLLARYYMTLLPYFSSTPDVGTTINVIRPYDIIKNIVSNNIPSNDYLKLAIVRFYSTWSEADLSFNIVINADTLITSAAIDVNITQSGGWAVSNIADKAIVSERIITAPTTSMIKSTDVIIVTTNLSTGYRESTIFLKNSSNSNRSYIIQAVGIDNKTQLIDGTQNPHIELLPNLESNITTLPIAYTGTTNTLGMYNNALYLARTDGSLVKITVDNSNVISAGLV